MAIRKFGTGEVQQVDVPVAPEPAQPRHEASQQVAPQPPTQPEPQVIEPESVRDSER